MWRIGFVSAGVSLLTALHWLLAQPEVVRIEKVQATMFAFILTSIQSDSQAYVAAFRYCVTALLVSGVIVSSALAILIYLKAAPTKTNRRLTMALGLGSLGAIFLGLIPFYQGYLTALQWHAGLWWRFLLLFAAYASLFCATVFFAQFFLSYPHAPSEAQWERHFELMLDEARASLRTGWRRRFYRKAADTAYRSERGSKNEAKGALTKHFLEGHINVGSALKKVAFFQSTKALWVMLALSAVCAGADTVAFCSSRADCFKPEWIGLARGGAAFAAFIAMEFALLTAFLGLQFHRRNAGIDDRTRVDWIYGTMLVAGLVLGAIPPLWWGSAIFWMPSLPVDQASAPGAVLFAGPLIVGLELFFIALLVSIALSIFYRGAIDPRLAARTITVFWLLGVLLAFVLILVERFVALKIVDILGIPRETGILVAGAAVAATLRPLHARTETWVNRFVSRYLPVDSLVSGERKRQAVLMSDLSGYTSLSAHDEKQALLLATLLQRTSERLCRNHSGRLVKSMGDAVMLTFDSAESAAQVAIQLHTEFHAAAKTLGFEPLPVHSGAHFGEVTETADRDLYGQTVNIAARLQGKASAGECVVSETFAHAARLADNAWRQLGPLQLKNVADPIAAGVLVLPS